MRRKDRQMSRDFALKIIDESAYGVLGLGGNNPYTLPLSIIRKGDYLYFHSAKAGRKVDQIKDGDLVSVTFVGQVQVPRLYSRDQIEDHIKMGNFSQIGSKIYTTEFESAHVSGRIYQVNDDEVKKEILYNIAEKYTVDLADLSLKFIEASLDRTAVYKIQMLEVNGKRKKYGPDGQELKFQK